MRLGSVPGPDKEILQLGYNFNSYSFYTVTPQMFIETKKSDQPIYNLNSITAEDLESLGSLLDDRSCVVVEYNAQEWEKEHDQKVLKFLRAIERREEYPEQEASELRAVWDSVMDIGEAGERPEKIWYAEEADIKNNGLYQYQDAEEILKDRGFYPEEVRFAQLPPNSGTDLERLNHNLENFSLSFERGEKEVIFFNRELFLSVIPEDQELREEIEAEYQLEN